MKVIILGAGASFDSLIKVSNVEGDNKWKPPLANQLFSEKENFREILSLYPGAVSIAADAQIAKDIEDYFQDLNDTFEINGTTSFLRQIISVQYYLRHLFIEISRNYFLVGDNAYTKLINKALNHYEKTKEPSCFITFNYDILLEKAYELIIGGIKNIDDYINNKAIKIIKPHGSCNWVKLIEEYEINNSENLSSHQLLDKYPHFPNLQDEIRIANDYNSSGLNVEPESIRVQPVFPQIIIPLKSKDAFVCPASHIEHMKHSLKTATSILFIGWRGSEKKFQELFLSSVNSSKVTFTNVNIGKEEVLDNLRLNGNFNNVSTYFNSPNPKIPQGSFQAFIRHLDTNPDAIFFS